MTKVKDLSARIRVKQIFWSKALFRFVILLVNIGILTLEQAVSIINKSFKYGGFKYRIDNGRWLNVDMSGKRIVISEVIKNERR